MASGQFTGTTANDRVQPKIVWTATPNTEGNYSTVTATLYYSRTNTGYTTEGDWTGGITINGSTKTATKVLRITYNSNTEAISYTVTVPHNADGTKSITISATGSIAYTTVTSTTISATVTLDTIPRATAPTLSTYSADMGTAVTINLPRATSSFTHTLAYSFNGGSYVQIAADVGTSYSWTVPDLASSIPNAASANMVIRCTTMSGGTSIGAKTVTLVAKVPASVVPTISAVNVAEATEGLAAQFGAYIQSKSTLAVSITAAGAKGSTISSYRSTLQNLQYTAASFTTSELMTSGDTPLVVTVTDSRGRTATQTIQLQVLSYSVPTIQAFNVYHCDADGNAVDDGAYLAVRYRYSAPELNGGNTVSMSVEALRTGDTGAYSQILTGTALTADTTEVLSAGLSADYSYTVRITLLDWFDAMAEASVYLPTAEVILDFSADGLSLGVGKVAEGTRQMVMGWDFNANGHKVTGLPEPENPTDAVPYSLLDSFMRTFLDRVYPVNSIYISYSHTSPATLFGGTWERVNNAFLWACDANGEIGKTGGEKTHTLTIDEMPDHDHWVAGNMQAASAPEFQGYFNASHNTATVKAWYAHTSHAGGGAAHNNMPPYIHVAVWRRTA